MLSDEEKAIEELKNKKADYFMISNLTGKTLVNLIEKQSKEIEEAEQKERKAYIDGTNVAHELCNKKWEDKIKAKIEEYEEKIKRIKEKDVWEEPYDSEKYVRYTNYISVLQSLLEEKE